MGLILPRTALSGPSEVTVADYTRGGILPIPSLVDAEVLRMPIDDQVDAAPMGGSVLVVDDDPFIARLLEIELKAAGYDVRVANDGARALDLSRERCPDLVLADVMMPTMDGFELTRRLRGDSRTASASVIMLTARGLSADKLEGRVRAGARFAILYADLDNFKAYNDHYGFMRGDQAIQFTADLLQEVARDDGGPETFVGHVGGDDFVVVCGAEDAQRLAERVVARFDESVPDLYDPEDRERGSIQVPNRRGETQEFPFVAISIGVATSERRSFAHFAEAVAVATEMKSFTKSRTGSSWAVDRRTT